MTIVSSNENLLKTDTNSWSLHIILNFLHGLKLRKSAIDYSYGNLSETDTNSWSPFIIFSRVLRYSITRSVDRFVGRLVSVTQYCSCPNAPVGLFVTAPAHPHATSVTSVTDLTSKTKKAFSLFSLSLQSPIVCLPPIKPCLFLLPLCL